MSAVYQSSYTKRFGHAMGWCGDPRQGEIVGLQMISDMADGHHREWEPEWFQRRTHQPQTITHRKVNEERSGHGH